MVVSLSKRLTFSMCLQSKAFVHLPVHWFGRTLLCPGYDRCPACKISRPKSFWYTAATMERKIEVVEMCDSLGRQLQEFAATLQRFQFRGIVARGNRANKRNTWTLLKCELREELIKDVADSVLIDAISQLYQLPLGRPGLSIEEWLKSAALVHLPLLSKCVIPM